MSYIDESDVVVHCESLHCDVPERKQSWPSNFHQQEKSVLKLVLQNVTVIYDMRIRPEVRKNILRKI